MGGGKWKPVLADVFVFRCDADLDLWKGYTISVLNAIKDLTLLTRSMQDFWSSDISRCLGHMHKMLQFYSAGEICA